MAFQPAAGERAEWHDRQALASGPVDGRDDQPPPESPALEFLGNLGVDENQPVPVAVVAEFGEMAALGDLESGRGLVVGDRYGIAHASIVASGARPPGPGCPLRQWYRGAGGGRGALGGRGGRGGCGGRCLPWPRGSQPHGSPASGSCTPSSSHGSP